MKSYNYFSGTNFSICISVMFCVFFSSCFIDEPVVPQKKFEHDWTLKRLLDLNKPIEAGFSFSIGNKGYIGDTYSDFFWEYDPVNNVWKQMADYQGGDRFGISTFSINQKGYVGAGYNNINYLKDFWEYRQDVNKWRQISSIPQERMSAIAFSFKEKGYCGFGYTPNSLQNNVTDFYEYDPLNDQWTRMPDLNIPGFPGIHEGISFIIDSTAYIGLGNQSNSIYTFDFQTKKWAFHSNNLPTHPKYGACAFTLYNEAYIGLGVNYFNTFITDCEAQRTFYKFIPSTSKWLKLENTPVAIGVSAELCFTLNNKAYIGFGKMCDNQISPFFWEYDPK